MSAADGALAACFIAAQLALHVDDARQLIDREEHHALRRSVRRYVDTEVRPHVVEWERAGRFPDSVFHRCGELGFLGLHYPAAYGGAEGGLRTYRIKENQERTAGNNDVNLVRDYERQPGTVHAVAWSPDGSLLAAGGSGGEEFRQVVLESWLPRLEEFKPQMIFVSAGFDAHYEDDMGGMKLFEKKGRMAHIPTVAQEVFDVSGAGDTVVSAFTLGLSCHASKLEAAHIANFAAGIVVGKVGTAVTTRKELLQRLG